MTRNLLLTGGIAHSFRKTSAAISKLLDEEGIDSVITDDIEAGLLSLDAYDVVTVNALRTKGGGLAEKFGSTSSNPTYSPSPQARQALMNFLEGGGAVLALHTAPICFDDWEEWKRIVGAKWRFGRSSHPPLGDMRVQVNKGSHVIAEGVDDFDVVDEIYSYMDMEPDVAPIITSRHSDVDHPLLWARSVGKGRSVYLGIGHDLRTIDNLSYQTLLKRSARWTVGELD